MKQVLLFVVLLVNFATNAQNPADTDFTLGTNYAAFTAVSKIVRQSDGKILVGGAHYSVTGRIARFNPDGSTDTSFQINSFSTYNNSYISIHQMVVQPDGKILVGGNFNKFNGEGSQSVNSIMRLNADGTKDTSFIHPWFTSGGAVTNDIALQPDGKIIIAGGFRVDVAGHNQYHACRLNSDGSIDDTFNFGPVGGPPQGSSNINAVALQSDGKVLLGGSFSQFSGQSQGKLIRLNADGSKDANFDVGTGGSSGYIVNNILIQPDNKILIGGGFTSWNGQPKKRMIRLNEDGSIDNGFINEFAVDDIEAPYDFALQSDGKIVVVGANYSLHDQSNIWRFNADGSFDSSLINNEFLNAINTVLVLPDGKIMIGGFLMQADRAMRNGFARLNTDGSIDSSLLSQGFSDEVITIAQQADGKTLLGGSFTAFDMVSQNRIIRINDDGTKDTNFNIGSGLNNRVKIITVQPNGKILIGGDFTTYNGQAANHIICLNQDGTKDTFFNVGAGFNEAVKTIALQPDGKIIIGGAFTQFNGQTQNYLIRLNADGTKDNTFVVGNMFNDRITTLLLQADGKVVVGGNFKLVNGIEQLHLVRLNTNGTWDTSFTPPQNAEFLWPYTTNDAIFDLITQPDGKIYVITSYIPRRLNTDGSVDSSFYLPVGNIKSIALQENGKILLAGTFDHYSNGSYYRGLMRLNQDGTIDNNFDMSFDDSTQYGGFYGNNSNDEYGCKKVLIQPDKKIWVGGNFFFYRGASSFGAIRLVGDSVLSVTDLDGLASDAIKLYPNPLQNTLNIQAKNDIQVNSVELYDVTGKLIMRPSNFENVNVSSLSNGIYIVKIKTSVGDVSKKLVKS